MSAASNLASFERFIYPNQAKGHLIGCSLHGVK